jgi:hypothetical protein
MSHLTADELVDAAEGTLSPARLAHVSECQICRGEAERLGMALRAATEADIPEPSPLFWQQLSARVHHAIAAEDATPLPWAPAWLRWRVLAPIAALALIVIALAAAVARGPAVGPVDFEQAREAGIVVRPGDVEEAALELTAAEQQLLLDLVKAASERPGL